jgi:hypothetical protein
MTTRTGRQSFRVGDQVRVRLGLRILLGIIVEDRGNIASDGSRLFRVKVDFDGTNVTFTEVPEGELQAAG